MQRCQSRYDHYLALLEQGGQQVCKHTLVFCPRLTSNLLVAPIKSHCNVISRYIKMDDDVVYFTRNAIEDMVAEKLKGECGLVSANVVNHSILSAVHNELGTDNSLTEGGSFLVPGRC